MATVLDAQFGIKDETTYGTPETVDRFYRPTDGDNINYRPNRVQGQGRRPGQVGARGATRVTPNGDYGGTMNFEVLSKGYGKMWEKLVGTSVSNVSSGDTYQQVHTLDAGPMKPFTAQYGVPQLASSGAATIKARTYAGCVVPSWGLTMDTNGILRLKVDIDAKSMSTATALATFAEPSGPNLFSFAGATVYTGAYTAPTTTALAIGATPIASATSFSLDVNRNADVADWRFGGKSIPFVAGLASVSGALGLVYEADMFVDAFLADTPMALVLNFTAGALSTGLETVQVAVAQIRLDGELPAATGEKPVMNATFTALEDGTNPLLQIVTRTADTAL